MALIASASSRLVSILIAILLVSCEAFSPSIPTKQKIPLPSSLAATPAYSALFGLAAKRAQPNDDSMFAIPAIWHSSDMRPVVLFDGKCNLCNAGVQLVLDYDRASTDPRGNLRVAALQSRVGKILLARLPKRQRDKVLSVSDKDKEYKSIVVTTPTKTYLNSAACIRIGRELRGPLRCLALLAWIIPPFIRDPLYKIMSRYRKRLFGESPECRLWDDNWDTRFVDDALFGGKGSNEMDPFADPSFKADEKEEEDDSDDDGDVETALPPNVGDTVRVISSKPIIHTHVAGYEEGLCSVGLVGTVTRVLDQRAYPKSVAVKFQTENDKGREFEAHFYPGQVRKE